MQVIATQKNIRQTPRKVRLVANEVKDLSLEDALRQLAVMQRRSSLVVLKVLKQAVANAMNDHQLPFEVLEIDSIQVVPGSILKRWNAVSRGRAHSIKKHTSHIQVTLKTKEVKKETKKEVAKKTVKKSSEK